MCVEDPYSTFSGFSTLSFNIQTALVRNCIKEKSINRPLVYAFAVQNTSFGSSEFLQRNSKVGPSLLKFFANKKGVPSLRLLFGVYQIMAVPTNTFGVAHKS